MVGHLARTNARATARSSKLKRCPSIQREFVRRTEGAARAPVGRKKTRYSLWL